MIARNDLARSRRINRILIADAHLLFRRGVRALLSGESDLQVIDEAADAAEALIKVRLSAPDVLVMDLALVAADGQEAAFSIRQAQPSIAILFLTQRDGPEQLELAIAAGGRGYMLKDSAPAQLAAGIRQIAAADDQNPQGLSRIVPDLRALAVSNEGYTRGAVLTAREQEVMRLLAEGRTVREVAFDLQLSVKTVEAHKLNLMRKLDIHNRAALIEYALEKGLIAVRVNQ